MPFPSSFSARMTPTPTVRPVVGPPSAVVHWTPDSTAAGAGCFNAYDDPEDWQSYDLPSAAVDCAALLSPAFAYTCAGDFCEACEFAGHCDAACGLGACDGGAGGGTPAPASRWTSSTASSFPSSTSPRSCSAAPAGTSSTRRSRAGAGRR